jgi:integrase
MKGGNSYNLSEALTSGGSTISRWKGEQRGSLKREGKSYYGRWREFVETADGKIEWKQVKRKLCPASDGKAEAIRILNENVSQAGGPAACHQGIATLRQFITARFEPDHIANLKQSGKDHYGYCLGKHILPALGAFRLKEFTHPMVQGFLTLKAKRLSPQTVRHLRNALSAVFGHAKRCGFWRGDLPTDYVRTPEVHEKKPRALSSDEVRRLLVCMEEPWRTLALVMTSVGLRIGEALALDWQHVDLKTGVIHVRRNWTHGEWGSLKSRNAVRDLPINHEMLMALEALQVPLAAGWLLWPNRRGGPQSAMNLAARELKPACKAAGLPPLGWHALRHTALTLLQQGGMTGPEAQMMAGHGTQAMTARYTHASMERLRAVVDGLNYTMQGTGVVQ